MKIEMIRIQNFRLFEDVTVNFNDYNCFVGANGAGKSTVLNALNLFFRQTENVQIDFLKPTEDDFNNRDTANPMRVTLTFSNLSEEAKEDFKNYYRNGKLIVSIEASYNEESKQIDVRQYGQREGIRDFKEFFESDKAKANVQELKEVYARIRDSGYEDLPPPAPKAKMIESLHEYEAANPDKCELIESDDAFYGFTKGANRLNKYVQWIYVPAVKDPAEEQDDSKKSTFSKLLERTVAGLVDFDPEMDALRAETQGKYDEIITEQQHLLRGISNSLSDRVTRWTHSNTNVGLSFKQDYDKTIKIEAPITAATIAEHGYASEIGRFGHGLQRTYIVALLEEMASVQNEEQPTLIIGFEEPELYQHPPQVRHFANLLYDLATQPNYQLLITSHSPHFVRGKSLECLRLVRKDTVNDKATVLKTTYDLIGAQTAAIKGIEPEKPNSTLCKLDGILQPELSEMFFSERVVFVEGQEDIAFIKTYLELRGDHQKLRELGIHIIPVNGKGSMYQPISVANTLHIPYLAMFDGDLGTKNSDAEKQTNSELIRLCGEGEHDGVISGFFVGKRVVVWESNIGDAVKGEMGADKWGHLSGEVTAHYGYQGVKNKNPMKIGAIMMLAGTQNFESTVLNTVCDKIVAKETWATEDN